MMGAWLKTRFIALYIFLKFKIKTVIQRSYLKVFFKRFNKLKKK